MKKNHAFILIQLLVVIAGCSSSNSDAPVVGDPVVHPAIRQINHSTAAKADLRGCQGCHGFDFSGDESTGAIDCLTCHPTAPPFTPGAGHPVSWSADPVQGHRDNFSSASNPTERIGWETCSTSGCHGENLEGSSGPSCLDNTASCHATSTNSGWPNAPHAMPYTSPIHGLAAKDSTGNGLNMGNYCLLCHGSPSNTFDGGFVTSIMGVTGTNCSASACHPDATAHPSDWIPANNSIFHSDGSLTTATETQACALCHNISAATPAGPMATAPSCFSATFQTQACHATGPGNAPHAVPFTDPDLHGPAAKADLVYCQACHGTTGTSTAVGAAGSNPRFNVRKGSLTTGCESASCHAANTAHPTGTDRWTFNRDTGNATRRTHFAAGLDSGGARDLAACSMCHDATSNASDNAGSAVCITCHQSLGVSGPSAGVKCNYCHQSPPDGANDLTVVTVSPGSASVTHTIGGTDVSSVALHEDCSLCHGASQNVSTGLLVAKGSYDLTLSNTSAAYQGGDHLDGNIEMNGPVGTGAGYNPTTFSCTQTCHGTEVGHLLSDSGLPVENSAYGAGACDSCHGYPPDASGGTNHLAANRDRAGGGSSSTDAVFFTAHGVCSTCHGLLGDTTPPTVADNFGTPVDISGSGGDAYDIASMHNQSLALNVVQMNGQGGANFPPDDANAAYNGTTNGCAAACHAADWTFVTVQTNTLDLREFGSGNCNACHGYPPAQGAHVRHAGGSTNYSYDCQVCHPSSTAPTHNESGIAPGGTLDPANVQVTLPAFGNFPSGGIFDSANKTCTATYCHGAATPPVWTSGVSQALCGSCHGIDTNGRPATPGTGGTHFGTAHAAENCDACHTHNNDEISPSEHANGPLSTNSAALVSTAGLKISGFTPGTTTVGTEAGKYNYSDSSCTTTCHGVGTWGGVGACDACHDVGGTGASPGPTVAWSNAGASGKSTNYGSHLQLTAGEALTGVTDWSARCMGCHPGHSVLDVNKQVLIPLPLASWNSRDDGSGTTWNMQTRLGIDYAASGANHGGITLGGSSTTSNFANANTPTEAEICWGCHGSGASNDTVNEWGFNTDTNGGSFPVVDISLQSPVPAGASTTPGSYNYGWLYSDAGWINETADWTGVGNGAYRRDAYQHTTVPSATDYVLSRQIASTHSVNFTSAKQDSSVANNVNGSGIVTHTSLENRADLRCSYCHDVHDMNKAILDASSGQPFLRGTWTGNPYPPDVPPLNAYTYQDSVNKAVDDTPNLGTPRPLSNGQVKGGFFIDLNSNNPTTQAGMTTQTETAGLCVLCHGTDVDNMDYYMGSSLWLGTNGHSYAVLGGGNSYPTNLFDGDRLFTNINTGGFNWMGMQADQFVGDWEGNFKSRMKDQGLVNDMPWGNNDDKTTLYNSGWYNDGVLTRQTVPVTDDWPTNYPNTSPDQDANPPVSTNHEVWYDSGATGNGVPPKFHNFTCSKCHSPHATGLPALLLTNCLDVGVSNLDLNGGRITPTIGAATNCHRKTSTATGWNTLAPGQ